MDKELAEKAAAKFDPKMEAEARGWIEGVLGKKLGECSLQEELKDGVVLCNLVNRLKPGVIPAPSTSKMPFKQMENIGRYTEACTKLGVPIHDTFQTVALYENKDMIAVITNIHSLGRIAQQKYLTPADYRGPSLGVKLSASTPREHTEAQRRAAAAAPTLLGKGSHGHATQARPPTPRARPEHGALPRGACTAGAAAPPWGAWAPAPSLPPGTRPPSRPIPGARPSLILGGRLPRRRACSTTRRTSSRPRTPPPPSPPR